MKKKIKRTSTQIHTRKLDRLVAKKQMHNKGITRICDRNDIRKNKPSYFSTHWKFFTNYGAEVLV